MSEETERDSSAETEPEIPKRSPFTLRAVIYGCLIGTLYVFLAIYVSLKTGVTFIAGTILLGYIFLSIKGKYNPRENVVITSIAEGSVLVGTSVIASLPAIVIYSQMISERRLDPIFYLQNITGNWWGKLWYDTILSPELLITLGLFAGITGLFMLLPFKEQLLKLPWPQVVPIYRTIEGLGDVEEAKSRLLKGMGVAAAYTGVFTALGLSLRQNLFQFPTTPIYPGWFTTLKTWWSQALPRWQQTAYAFLAHGPLPDFLGISNSPLIGAMGYFVGWKRALVIFAGSVWSLIVWIIWEGGDRLANFGNHVMLPMIYYTSMGVLVAYLTWEFVKIGLRYREEQRKMQELSEQLIKAAAEGKIDAEQVAPYIAIQELGTFGKIKHSVSFAIASLRQQMSLMGRKILPMIFAIAIFIVGSILMFNVFNPFPNIFGYKVLDVPWPLTLGTAPLLAFSGWWFARAAGEAGFVVNYLTDTIVVPAIMIFSMNFPSIVIFTTILNTMQQSAGRFIGRVKVGRVLKVKDKIVTKAMLVGIVFGAFISGYIIMELYSVGGFGTTTFPAPAAAITGLFFMTVVELKNAWLGGGGGAAGAAGAADPTSAILQYVSDLFKPWYAQNWFVEQYGAVVFLAAGFAIGLVLAKFDWSPISLAVGLLIPPAYGFTMLLGGLLNFHVYRKYKEDKAKYYREEMKYQHALGGAATGDGVVQVFWILAMMFMF